MYQVISYSHFVLLIYQALSGQFKIHMQINSNLALEVSVAVICRWIFLFFSHTLLVYL